MLMEFHKWFFLKEMWKIFHAVTIGITYPSLETRDQKIFPINGEIQTSVRRADAPAEYQAGPKSCPECDYTHSYY